MKYLTIITIAVALAAVVYSCSSDSKSPMNRLTVTAVPAEGGTVTPQSGEYESGQQVEISATAHEHWLFERWEGDFGGIQNPVMITMDSDKNVAALFVKKEYALNITIQGQGTVVERIVQPRSNEYPHGTVVELEAVAAEGWEFSHWEGGLEGDENPATITIDGQASVTAVFTGLGYPLTITIEGEGTVQEEVVQVKANEYPLGTVVRLTAQPSEGWQFVEWQGDLEGTQNPAEITIEGEREVTAVFEKRDYPLTITIQGDGTVTERVVQARSTEYPHGTVVELEAVAGEGSEFERWEGDLAGSENPVTLTIDSEKSVTAVFSGVEYPLTVTIEGEGSVSEKVVQARATEYPVGTHVELEALPEENWIFSQWSGDLGGDENPAVIEIDGPKEVTATFLRTFRLTTLIEPEADAGVVTPEAGDYVRDTDIEVEAIANHGWVFSHWEGDFSGSVNPFNLTMNGNKTLTAHFGRDEFTLEIETQGEGSVDVELISGTQTSDGFLYETVVKLTALPDEDWNFIEWQGDAAGTGETIEITIDDNVSIIAVFSEFAGGDGSASNPYQVANLHQLQRVGSYLDKHFIQIADIDASETENWNNGDGFLPIANEGEMFSGQFNGGYFQIENLSVWAGGDGNDAIGLFRYTTETAVIKHLKILNLKVSGVILKRFGGIAGVNHGHIDNSIVTGRLLTYESAVAGLVVVNYGTITNSSVNAEIEVDESSAAGLVMHNTTSGFISESFFKGKISGVVTSGLVHANYGTIEKSQTSGTIQAVGGSTSWAVACGFVRNNSGIIRESQSQANVSAGGGEEGAHAAGFNCFNSGTIENSQSSGEVTAIQALDSFVGGFVSSNSGEITGSFSLSSVVVDNPHEGAYTSIGGFAGLNSGSISGCYSLGELIHSSNSIWYNYGGLVGNNEGTIDQCYSAGASTFTLLGMGNPELILHGALIGNNTGTVENSYWDEKVNDSLPGIDEGDDEGATGLTTDHMTGADAQSYMIEFDWVNIWRVSSSYPVLWWQVE